MGVVDLAERDDGQFDQRIALKLLPPGLDSAERERRLRSERQILASLEHPNIACLLDGGVTANFAAPRPRTRHLLVGVRVTESASTRYEVDR